MCSINMFFFCLAPATTRTARKMSPCPRPTRTPLLPLLPTLTPVCRHRLRARKSERQMLARPRSLRPTCLRQVSRSLPPRCLLKSALTTLTGLGRFFHTRSKGLCGKFGQSGRAARSCLSTLVWYTLTIDTPILFPTSHIPSSGSV